MHAWGDQEGKALRTCTISETLAIKGNGPKAHSNSKKWKCAPSARNLENDFGAPDVYEQADLRLNKMECIGGM